MLEIIGSAVVGGLIFLIILQMNSGIMDSSTSLTMGTYTQGNLTELTEEIEYFFRKIGYDVSAVPVITTADSNRITFLSDIDVDGTVDSVSFYVSDTSALSYTMNPFDKLLYRKINDDTPITSDLGVTDFDLWYYDATGNITATLSNIKYIKYALTLQSSHPYDGEYSTVYVERVIQPNNLR